MPDPAERNAWVHRVLGIEPADGSTIPVPPATAATPRLTPLETWRAAREEADRQLVALQGALRGLKHPFFARIADEGLGSITGRLQVGLQAALLDLDHAAGDPGRRAKVRKAAGDFRAFLAAEPALLLLEANPFGIEFELRAVLGDALADIEASV